MVVFTSFDNLQNSLEDPLVSSVSIDLNLLIWWSFEPKVKTEDRMSSTALYNLILQTTINNIFESFNIDIVQQVSYKRLSWDTDLSKTLDSANDPIELGAPCRQA